MDPIGRNIEKNFPDVPKNDVKREKTWQILDQDSGTFLLSIF